MSEIKIVPDEDYIGDDKPKMPSASSFDLENAYNAMKPSERMFILKLNAILYLSSTIALVISVAFGSWTTNVFTMFSDSTKYYTPSRPQVTIFWSIMMMLQGLFAFLPLIYKRENFIKLCCTHIGFHFAICQMGLILLICTLLLKSLISETKNYRFTFGLTLYILAMKIHVLIFIYNRVKYLDEGQDYVGFTEFTCIHANFAIYSCMLSYLFMALIICTYTEYIDQDGHLTLAQAQNYRLIICSTLILESWVNMANYKDLVYGLSISQILAGIYSNFFASRYDNKDVYSETEIQNKVLVGIIIGEILSVIITFAYHHKSSVYIKYKDWAQLIYGSIKQKIKVDEHTNKKIPTELRHKIEQMFDSKSKYSVITDNSFDKMSIITNS